MAWRSTALQLCPRHNSITQAVPALAAAAAASLVPLQMLQPSSRPDQLPVQALSPASQPA